MKIKADDRLLTLAKDIFASKGTDVAEAGFIPTKEFNFRWRANGGNVSIFVSDYLDDAPDEVISQFLKGASTYIFGGKHTFGKAYMDYMTSDDFILRKRPLYFKRARRIARTDIGIHRNLFDSVQRLLDAGLLTEKDIDNTIFSWTTEPTFMRLGYCAQMFRVVVISRIFDEPDVPQDLLDFVVYHECLHLRQGYRPFNRNPHDSDFKKQEKMFPDYAAVNKLLNDTVSRLKKRR